MTLRPYQLDAIAAVRRSWREYPDKGALLVLATGTGKTITAATLASQAAARGHRVLWLAHRAELVRQAERALASVGAAGVTVASIDRLRRGVHLTRYLADGPPLLVVLDEAHHVVAPTRAELIARLAPRYLLGLTATPAPGMEEGWHVAASFSVVRAIREGYLVPPRWECRPLAGLDLDRVTLGAGRRDYLAPELGAELLRAGVVAHTAACVPPDRRTIVYTATVEQARLTAAAIGSDAAAVSGETPAEERAELLRRFEAGEARVLCNALVLTEGTDLPACDCVVIARPTQSRTLYQQILGRGMRLAPGKTECLVIDIARASDEHGLVSAPVLLEVLARAECEASPLGIHVWVEGRCSACGLRAACPDSPTHAHEWRRERCRWCDRQQCEDSPLGRHQWRASGDGLSGRRECLACGIEGLDPVAALVGRRQRPPSERARWAQCWGGARPLWCALAGSWGVLLVSGGVPWWVRPASLARGGELAPMRLCDVVLAEDDARRLCEEVIDASPASPRQPGWEAKMRFHAAKRRIRTDIPIEEVETAVIASRGRQVARKYLGGKL